MRKTFTSPSSYVFKNNRLCFLLLLLLLLNFFFWSSCSFGFGLLLLFRSPSLNWWWTRTLALYLCPTGPPREDRNAPISAQDGENQLHVSLFPRREGVPPTPLQSFPQPEETSRNSTFWRFYNENFPRFFTKRNTLGRKAFDFLKKRVLARFISSPERF